MSNMKAWITRDDKLGLVFSGIKKCRIWLQKPWYDFSKRADRDHQLFAGLDVGWRLGESDDYTDQRELCTDIDKLLWDEAYPDISEQVWKAICIDVDGCLKGDWQHPYERWHEEWEEEYGTEKQDVGFKTFCYEFDIPFQMFWKIAQKDCAINISSAHWHQTILYGYDTWDSIPF